MGRAGLNGDGYRVFTAGGVLEAQVWQCDHPQAQEAERLFVQRNKVHAVRVFPRVVRAGGVAVAVRVGIARTRA